MKTLTTIPSLDAGRYMGTWYEIAKFPNRFQRKCASDTTATYSLRDDGLVRVLNRCVTTSGGQDLADGVARQVGGPSSPRLKVRFAPSFLSFLPFVWGDYWIIDLDEDYQLSAVSEPGRRYLWILSRAPRVDPEAYDTLLARLTAKGFDVSRLETTLHTRS